MATELQMTNDLQKTQTNEKIPSSPQKAEQWVIDVIGRLLLELHQKKIIARSTAWTIQKIQMRQEYNKFMNSTPENLKILQKLFQLYGALNIGNLLHRTGFLLNTPRGCDYFRIRHIAFLEYRKNIINAIDERCINGEQLDFKKYIHGTGTSASTTKSTSETLEPAYEVDKNALVHKLVFEGSNSSKIDKDFELTSFGCYICQRNFDSTEAYEDHVTYHSDDSDFQSLNAMNKNATNILELSYQVCVKSHFFCFTIRRTHAEMCHTLSYESDDSNESADSVGTDGEPGAVIIDKIIIVQTRSMCYVHNKRVPYELPPTGEDTFFVDSHLFTRYLEQPIVIVYHFENCPHRRHIEQHHFMRTEEFPTLMFGISPRHLPNKKLFKAKTKVPAYLPGEFLRVAAKTPNLLAYVLNTSEHFRDYYENGKVLTPFNYREVMSFLLKIEDVDTINEYSQLTQRKVSLRKFEDGYSFQMEAANNNSLDQIMSLYDDVIVIDENSKFHDKLTETRIANIIMQQDKGQNKSIYFGMIEQISNGRVTFVCDKSVDVNNSYTIVIRPNRTQLRFQYRALALLDAMPDSDLLRLLFPINIPPEPLTSAFAQLTLTNDEIYQNPEQLQAVKYIAHGPRLDAPYIIHGPPGTGKTTTLVEAILQLYFRSRDTKILVTAGSNSACDELALRLCRVLSKLDETRAIVRIYARANERRSDNIDELLLDYSNMYAGQFFPDIDVLHEYRIIVCTLGVVGKLATGRFGKDERGRGIFTHIIIDEVAATTETETLIAIANIVQQQTSVIIAGDHKQLSAVLKSPTAESWGLGKSLMERLIERNCYRLDPLDNSYDSSIQTRLLRNHRSHPKIVELYSNLFYDGRLIAAMSHAEHAHCERWSGAPSSTFPIIFHSIFGYAARGNTVSMSNQQELDVVMDYVRDFMYFGINGITITESDIGIISPYKRQYMRVQEELNRRNWYGIETGSVETFQGREKTIIIVSFVRSFQSTLGFLDNMKRLNVVLSRAKSLLILIGNPQTLSLNAEFRQIIKLCKANNTLVGARIFDKDANGNNDATRQPQHANYNNNNNNNKKPAFKPKPKPKQQQQQQQEKSKNNAGIIQRQRRQPMKHAKNTQPHNRHHHNKPNQDESVHSTKTTNSEASSLAGSMQNIQLIDDYFESLPVMRNKPASCTNAKPINEEDLIARAKKLNILREMPSNSVPNALAASVGAKSPDGLNKTAANAPPTPTNRLHEQATVSTAQPIAIRTSTTTTYPLSGTVGHGNGMPNGIVRQTQFSQTRATAQTSNSARSAANLSSATMRFTPTSMATGQIAPTPYASLSTVHIYPQNTRTAYDFAARPGAGVFRRVNINPPQQKKKSCIIS